MGRKGEGGQDQWDSSGWLGAQVVPNATGTATEWFLWNLLRAALRERLSQPQAPGAAWQTGTELGNEPLHKRDGSQRGTEQHNCCARPALWSLPEPFWLTVFTKALG